MENYKKVIGTNCKNSIGKTNLLLQIIGQSHLTSFSKTPEKLIYIEDYTKTYVLITCKEPQGFRIVLLRQQPMM